MTVLELLIVVALVGVLAALAGSHFVQRIQTAKVARAMGEIRTLEGEIDAFVLEHGYLPSSLEEVIGGEQLDPWGFPYRFFAFQGAGWRSKVRRDRFLVPLNSTYDLYSVGPDGDTRRPLPPPMSWDDVIRANDGFFIGKASDF